MTKRLWWHDPLRVIQYNLQVKDTLLMDPEKIAGDTQALSANVLVINVGGIYAWYPSKVPCHHVNEYLPRDFDLLGRLIDACHRRGIRVVARFDFSKADDVVSLRHPDWFIRNPDGSRRAYGAERAGDWSILYSTCINAGYRNEAMAVPVLREVIDLYPIDGIFLNAPHYEYCACAACRAKYQALYGKPLPIRETPDNAEPSYGWKQPPKELERGFPGLCYRDNIGKLYAAIKEKAPDLPLILYFSLYNENLEDRLSTCDMLCIEAQDVLSRGWRDIPPMWLPTLIMKLGRAQPEGHPKPFGIIHSCPGMDWRHTGMPMAEYRQWLRQIPAAGGSIWHSITGFNDTITDKRILRAVSEVNAEIVRIEAAMEGARELSDALLLWNSEDASGWAQLLVNTQTQFDLRKPEQLDEELLNLYPVVIAPDACSLTEKVIDMLRDYTVRGGNLIVEGISETRLRPFADALGIYEVVTTSEPLTACYWQFEGDTLRRGFEETPVIVHRGVTAYTSPLEGTQVLATLIPPFAPLNSVGAPPERASLPVRHTDIPLCTVNYYGHGRAVMLPFRLSELADTYRLAETYQVWNNLLDHLLGNTRMLRMDSAVGLIVTAYANGEGLLLHLVNACGARPIAAQKPYVDFQVMLRLPEDSEVLGVEDALEDSEFSWHVKDGRLILDFARLNLWAMLKIRLTQVS